MKKSLLFIIFFIVVSGFTQEYKMVSEELKGPVKSVEIIMLNTDKKVPLEIKNFDSKGRLLESKTFYDGRLQTNQRNTYQNNTIISEFCDNCDDLDKAFANFVIKENQKNPYSGYATSNPIKTTKTIKTTDKNSNVIVSKVYNAQGYLKWSTQSKFDNNSNLLLEENFDLEGKKTSSYKIKKYNEKGLVEEELTSGKNYQTKSIYTYDNLGQKIADKEVQENRITEYVYEYSTENDSIKELSYYINPNDGTKSLRNKKHSYFQNGIKITKEVDFNNIKTTATRFFEFDKKNNLISKKEYNDKNELRSEIKLVYDNKSNWIKMDYSYLVQASYDGSAPRPEWRTNHYLRTILYY